MYAVIELQGKQFRVEEGDVFPIPRRQGAEGEELAADRVLLVGGDNLKVGTPVVDGARVVLTVVAHRRGPKIRGFKYKPKSGYKRAWGHRDELTVVRVERIEV